MILGEESVSNIAAAESVVYAPVTTFTDIFATRQMELIQPAPLLCFWDVETPGSTLRYVDFADQDAAGLLSTTLVPFDGNNYTAIKIDRSDISENAELASASMTVSIADPLHTAAATLRNNDGLVDQRVTLRCIPYDYLAYPDIAQTWTFRIRGASVLQNPDRISVTLGLPNLFEQRFPRVLFNRNRCFNEWQERFTVGNLCTWPSDEFEATTRQFLRRNVATEVEHRHGWFTINADAADLVYATDQLEPGSSVDHVLYVHGEITAGNKMRWLNANREGPYLYKKVTGDFDVYTKIHDSSLGSLAEMTIGLLVQSTTDNSDWLFWGWHENTGFDYSKRQTVNDVTTETITSSGSPLDTAFRIKRSGNTFSLYRTFLDITVKDQEHPSSWTQQGSSFTLDLGSTVRVGLVGGTDDTTNTRQLRCFFFYCRFLENATFTDCDRSFDDCTLRKNLYQFNGFIGMPIL